MVLVWYFSHTIKCKLYGTIWKTLKKVESLIKLTQKITIGGSNTVNGVQATWVTNTKLKFLET